MRKDNERVKKNKIVIDYCNAKKAGDKKEARRLKNIVISELSLYCKKIAYGWSKQKPELKEDLQQSAIMGMLIALDRFDNNKSNGAHFTSFAYRHIVEHIVECFKSDEDIKISDTKKRLIPSIIRFIKKYQKEHNKNPDFNLISEETDVDIKDVIDIIGIYYSKHNSVSLNADIPNTEENLNFEDVIADKSSGGFERYCESNINVIAKASKMYRKLSINQMNVFFYIHTTNSKTKDAAKVLGLSYERCRQLNKESVDLVMPNTDSFFADKYLTKESVTLN